MPKLLALALVVVGLLGVPLGGLLYAATGQPWWRAVGCAATAAVLFLFGALLGLGIWLGPTGPELHKRLAQRLEGYALVMMGLWVIGNPAVQILVLPDPALQGVIDLLSWVVLGLAVVAVILHVSLLTWPGDADSGDDGPDKGC